MPRSDKYPRCAIARLESLRPTQLTLGMNQVREKMDVTLEAGKDDQGRPSPAAMRRFARSHRICCILGPGAVLYIADHHHWARAWTELGCRSAPVRIIEDLSGVDPEDFWDALRARGHLHPYDEHGELRDPSELPPNVRGMRDDPYRSLAAFARQAGGYRKPGNAYGDFSWAGFFRDQIHEDVCSIAGFARALAMAIKLAGTRRARRLPGYCGPDPAPSGKAAKGEGGKPRKKSTRKSAGNDDRNAGK